MFENNGYVHVYIIASGQGQTTPWGQLFSLTVLFSQYSPLLQPRVIIYINFVELESPMLHAKFQDHRTSGSGEEDFLRVLYMGMTAILVM